MQRSNAKLVNIMRRNVRRHAHRDAGGTICQKLRKGSWQHDRLLLGPIVIIFEINRVLGQAFHHRNGGVGQPRLRITLGRGVIAVDITEVSLTIHQRITHRKILRQPRQSIINRLVAVGVIVTHHLTDNLGAFTVTARRVQLQAAHGVHDPPMHRFHAVTRIRQGTVHNRGQRIRQIPIPKRTAQGFGRHRAAIGYFGGVSLFYHTCCV